MEEKKCNRCGELLPLSMFNKNKSTKDMLSWYQEQEFYSEERLQKIFEWQEYAYQKWGESEIAC